MTQFVQQHEQHVTGHELREPLNILLGQVFEFRIAPAERKDGRVDPVLKPSRFDRMRGPSRSSRLCWSWLRQQWLHREYEEAQRHKPQTQPVRRSTTGLQGWPLCGVVACPHS